MNLQDLEKYRNEKGYIDFDRIEGDIGFDAFSPKREVRGTQSREKMWLHLDDDTVLLKTVEKGTNLEGTCYAELITAELAKQAGFSTARVDLVKFNGYLGIISSKVNKDDEQLHSLREYIGDEDIPDDPFPEITGTDFVFDNLVEHLSRSELSKADKYLLLQSLMKLMVFDVVTLNTDRHTENISFIEKMNNGKKEIVLAPLYDNEFSLMLETKEKDLNEYLLDYTVFYDFVDAQEPKIAPKYEGIEEEERPRHYLNLLESLLDMDEDLMPYLVDLIKKLDVNRAIETVEQRIKAPIPEVFKGTAIYSYGRRKQEIIDELLWDIDLEESNDLQEENNPEEIKDSEESNNLEELKDSAGSNNLKESERPAKTSKYDDQDDR